MSKNKENIELDNLDDWLCSTGFIYPTNEYQLERLNKLYDNYEFKLKDSIIDVSSILNGQFCNNSSVIRLVDNETKHEISELRMVARNGLESLSKEVIDKMYKKHHRDSDDKQ